MKKHEVLKIMKKCGWELKRNGSNHDIWCKGDKVISVPRHKDINHLTSIRIIKEAKS